MRQTDRLLRNALYSSAVKMKFDPTHLLYPCCSVACLTAFGICFASRGWQQRTAQAQSMSRSEGVTRAAGVQPSMSSPFLGGIITSEGGGRAGLVDRGLQGAATRSVQLHSSERSTSARRQKNKETGQTGGGGGRVSQDHRIMLRAYLCAPGLVGVPSELTSLRA